MDSILTISSIFLWMVVIFNLLLTLGLTRRIRNISQKPEFELLKVGQPAPDFSAQTLDGQIIGLRDYAAQAVGFLFVSPHCQPCRDQLPAIPTLGAKARKRGIQLVLVSGGDETELQSIARELSEDVTFLVAQQDRTSFLDDYKGTITPSYCLVDAKGIVRASGLGLLELERHL